MSWTKVKKEVRGWRTLSQMNTVRSLWCAQLMKEQSHFKGFDPCYEPVQRVESFTGDLIHPWILWGVVDVLKWWKNNIPSMVMTNTMNQNEQEGRGRRPDASMNSARSLGSAQLTRDQSHSNGVDPGYEPSTIGWPWITSWVTHEYWQVHYGCSYD